MICLYKNRQGFTLLEILVSLAISSFVLMAAMSIFNSSELSYNIQEDVAAMQQDVRVGKSFIEREARMAGAGLENYPAVAGLDPEKDLVPFTIDNNQGENGSDILTISYVVPLPDSCGDDPDTSDGVTMSCSDLPALTLQDGMPTGSSEAKIYENLSDSPYDKWDDGCYCGGKSYPSPDFGFPFLIETPGGYTPAESEIVILTQVQDTGGDDKLQNRKYTDDEGVTHENKVMNDYPDSSVLRFFSLQPIDAWRFFIQNNVLMREDLQNDPGNPQPIAEHIEDLQFAFGIDDDDDNVVDRWVDCSNSADMDDTNVNDIDYDLKYKIRKLRINVLGRTAKARKEIEPSLRPALEDHAAAGTEDYFRRRLSKIEVKLRNIGIWEEGI